MGILLSKAQRHYYALTATMVTWLLADTASAQSIVIDRPMNWIKENIMAFINNDLWSWLALVGFLWEIWLWRTNKRSEHIVWACCSGIFGMVWMMRADIMGAWGAM